VIEGLKEKHVDLQEEMSETLTDLQAARDSSEKLSVSFFYLFQGLIRLKLCLLLLN
jgi:hypothetical protein